MEAPSLRFERVLPCPHETRQQRAQPCVQSNCSNLHFTVAATPCDWSHGRTMLRTSRFRGSKGLSSRDSGAQAVLTTVALEARADPPCFTTVVHTADNFPLRIFPRSGCLLSRQVLDIDNHFLICTLLDCDSRKYLTWLCSRT